MKKLLIFLSVFVIGLIAFFDAKERLAELGSVAANTPSQIEMKQMINKTDEQMMRHVPDFQTSEQKESQTIQDKMNAGRADSQNQLNNVDKRRDTINNRQ